MLKTKRHTFLLLHGPSALFLCWALCRGIFCFAQQPPARSFTHLSVEDGLSQSSVISIVQDSAGFMWLGTRNCLNRYNASAEYRSAPGGNGNFILKHSVGSIPHGFELDTPLIYADYYFIEALARYHALVK